ncbi:unnamed protein product [Diatraea saccharalis]|uniref:Carboxylesterase type B domain-containing protein n=1 Tax=Diatraea saccharalis TaxID=40085 RepID=A0A9N9R024_9NEOP|nr:unnamed protein product [Diatraea saccharalis]
MIVKILISFICITGLAKSSIIVTNSGPVLGKLVKDDNGVTYYAYQGIPYAESPEGELRFKPPVPKKKWLSVLNATEKGPICPQAEGHITREEMSEDCLKLNIVVPAKNETKLRPVFFYIHGGSFKSNTGNIDKYQPQWILEEDIIYVSINYRLGALGFLQLNMNEGSEQKEDAAGNAGIKDVILALKWIKNNIKKFGGSSITIGGQSSGAAMVHYLLLTEKSSGLFERAILKSGSATNFRFFSAYPKQHTFALAKELGFATDNIKVLMQNLINADVFDIIKAQENLYKNNRSIMRPFAPFLPCIEKKSSHAVLTKHPKNIIQSSIPQNVPILTGINSQEGLYMWPSVMEKTVQELKDNFTLCIPYDIEYPISSSNYRRLVTSISHLYFGGPDLNKWTLNNFFDLLSDTQYASSVDLWLRIHTSKTLSQPVFYYNLDFNGGLNFAKIIYNITHPGTAHADDLGYMFITDVTRSKIKDLDIKTRNTLKNTLTYLTNFIKFG